MTQGTSLARPCPEGFRHRPPWKTNPERIADGANSLAIDSLAPLHLLAVPQD
jgi:hypothetical protein